LGESETKNDLYIRQRIADDMFSIDGIPLTNRGIYGTCTCGGNVFYFSNRGVMCDTCRKLYGVWQNKRGRPKSKFRN